MAQLPAHFDIDQRGSAQSQLFFADFSEQAMKIERYLESIFQEFASETPLAGGWPGKGGCPCQGGGIARPPSESSQSGITNAFLRPEEFGGLLFNPATSSVYSLDNEAFYFLKTIQETPSDQLLPIEQLAKKYQIGAEALGALINTLRDASLWSSYEPPLQQV